MGFIRTIKDVILITPWAISFIILFITMGFIHLLLLFPSFLIFIYNGIERKLKWLTNQQ